MASGLLLQTTVHVVLASDSLILISCNFVWLCDSLCQLLLFVLNVQQVSSLMRQPPGISRAATPPLKKPHPAMGSAVPSPPTLHTPPKLQRPSGPLTNPTKPVCVCVWGRRVSHAENAVLVSFSRVLQGDVQASMPKLTPLDPLKQPSPAPAPLPISGKSSTTPAMPQVTPRACSATYQLGHNVRYYSGHKAKDCKPGNMPTKLSSLPLAPQDCSSCPTFS